MTKKKMAVCAERGRRWKKNGLSAIIEIICAIVHDSRALNMYTVVCTAKFL
jgi:hypothetical protein